MLSSREDPFPSVALIALANEVPVIVFKNTGGIEELIDDKNGKVVGHLDTREMSDAVLSYLQRPKPPRKIMNFNSSYNEYVKKLVGLFKNKSISEELHCKKKISVIVPIFNHEKYIRERLESILNQTHKPDEIILLDDASSDHSIEIAREILRETDVAYQIILNIENQGVFKQWIKGIELAKNDYIWIAEDDDKCKNNFLETLSPAFNNPDVKLAFCNSSAIDKDGKILFSYKHHTSRYLERLMSKPFIKSGNEIVNNGLAITNIIPNASSVVFRRFNTKKFENIIFDLKLAGDWVFYLYALINGKVSYSPKSLNYHRLHEKTSINKYEFSSKRFEENLIVQRTVFLLYKIKRHTRKLMHEQAKTIWKIIFPEKTIKEFEEVYSKELQNVKTKISG